MGKYRIGVAGVEKYWGNAGNTGDFERAGNIVVDDRVDAVRDAEEEATASSTAVALIALLEEA